MVRAVERAHEIGADAIQVFADNPTAWKRRMTPPRELPAFRRRLEELEIAPVATHAAYLINLAGPDESFYAKSVATLVAELRAGEAYGAAFVNVHMGSHRGSGVEAGTERVAAAVVRALREVPDGARAPRLVLENSAGGGFGLGATLEELAGVIEAIARRGVPDGRVGLCLDTAHLWGAGYKISLPEVVDEVVASFDRLIGIDRLAMVHFNDTSAGLGSHHDRHQHVGAGEIGPVGMAAILCHPALDTVTYYVETPGMDEGYDAVNIARARDLAAGRLLAELPPEAMHLRGSRARTPPEAEREAV
jgi:deoxyribonuclease-4